MRKLIFTSFLLTPVVLSLLVFNRIQSTKVQIQSSFDPQNLTSAANIQMAESLLNQNLDDLKSTLSSYQPLPEILDLAPDLLTQANLLLEQKRAFENLKMDQITTLPDSKPDLYYLAANTSIQLQESLAKFEHLWQTNYKQIQKLPVWQPIAGLNQLFQFAKQNYGQILESAHYSNQLLTVLNNILGIQKPHTYLVLIQNNNELRGSGGFLGLLGFIEIDNLQIKSIEFKDIYDFDGLFEGFDNPPIEFRDHNQKLFIRDLNFSPDFKQVATQIEQVLQSTGAPSFDTIIAVNHSFFKQLAPLISQVSIDGKNYTPNSNFDFILSYLVESKSHGLNQSKSRVSEMLKSLPEQILATTTPKQLAQLILSGVNSRQLQFYSKLEELDKAFEFFQARSSTNLIAQSQTNQNSNFLVFNSVSGTKGDRFIDRHITFTDKFFPDYVQTTVDVDFTHTYTNQTEIQLNSLLSQYGLPHLSGDLRYILGRGDYQAYIRSYLPPNAQLTDSNLKFFNQKDQFNNSPTFVAGFGMTPGQITRFQFTYQTPIEFSSAHPINYSFNSLYQPGLNNAKITHILDTTGIELHSFAPKTYKFKNGSLFLTTDFISDFKANFLISPSFQN